MTARPSLPPAAPGPDTTLPALRGLAKLADLRPVIAVDTREQEPLKFTRLEAVSFALFTGDYSIRGLEGQLCRRTQEHRRLGQLMSVLEP